MEQMNPVNCANCGEDVGVPLTQTRNVGTSGRSKLEIVVCKECGLCYLNPQPTKAMYTAYYATYGRKNKSVDVLIREKEEQREYIDLFDTYLTKASRILDVGCGKAIFLSFLKERGYSNLFGIELSRDEIDFAKKTFDLDIEYATIENYSGGDFDAAVLIAMIEHYTNPKESLAAVRRSLKDGGILFISTPNVKRMILRKGVSNYFKFVHTYYFSLETLKSIVQQSGFEILDARETPAEVFRGALYPRHYKNSDLLVVARKVPQQERTIIKEDYQDIFKIFSRAKRRDRLASAIFFLDQLPGFGALFRMIRVVF